MCSTYVSLILIVIILLLLFHWWKILHVNHYNVISIQLPISVHACAQHHNKLILAIANILKILVCYTQVCAPEVCKYRKWLEITSKRPTPGFNGGADFSRRNRMQKEKQSNIHTPHPPKKAIMIMRPFTLGYKLRFGSIPALD